MAMFNTTGFLTRVGDPGYSCCLHSILDHLFWRILC
nr:MAG TPA: hypothetical protein [Caudoviricetes sp.]